MSEQAEREKEIFSEALELGSPEARSGYVRGACGLDHKLRERVEALLKAYESAGGFIPTRSGLAEEIPTVTVPVALTEIPGTVIGRYKLLEKIGEGGFGAVYVAEQREPVKRRVALKIIKLGLDTRQVVARFEAERQALALMDHPNIAKVLDGGATETGRPYFVMELVRGIPVTQYCDEHHLSTDERLKLFMLVCQAIQHAHQKGIIHRDIKPSNILLTVNDGVAVPKVIDFGIAKATQGELTEKTVYTQFQQFIGTPAYMSPEQANMTSLDIDTRSDIYALGVLLYELLVGQTPFDAKELLLSGLDEMRRTIREKEPIRPSTRLESLAGEERTTTARRRGADMAKLTAMLRGDVDWIVMKCLEKDRTRRYATANGLAADVKRYLTNEPIVARPPSTLYRVKKLVRRNKVAFAAAASVAAALVLGVVASAWQAVCATRAGEAAVKATAREAVQHKLADLQLALQAWEEGDVQRADDLIEAARPGPGQPPGFEWRYLRNLCHDESAEPVADRPYRSAFFLNSDWLILGEEEKLTLRDLNHRPDQTLLEDSDGMGLPTLCFGNTNLLATAARDGRIKVWDLAAKQVLVEFEGHTGSAINALVFSRDGKYLASTGSASTGGGFTRRSDNDVKLWDVAAKERQAVRTVYRYSYKAINVAFSPDGRELFSSGTERMIRAWDVATGSETATSLEGHTGWVYPLATSPDGHWLASGSGDTTVMIWNVNSHKPERRLLGHIAGVQALTFSPDGRILASGGRDHTIRLWDMNTGQQLCLLRGHSGVVNSLSFSPDGHWLVSQSKDGLVKLWDVTSAVQGHTLTGSPIWLQHVALSPDGRRLATVGVDSVAVSLWELPTRSCSFLTGHSNTVMCTAFSPDGNILATGSHDQTARLWNVNDGKALATLSNGFPVGSLAFAPDGRTLVVGGSSWYFLEGDKAGLQFWDVPSREATGTLPGDVSNIVEVAFSADGSLLATGHKDGQVHLWDPKTRQLLHSFESPFRSLVISLAFSPTEPLLAASDQDGNIVLYNSATLRLVQPPLKAHTWRVMSLAFSPDGRTLASAGEGGGLKLWHVATRQMALTLKGHVGTVTGVAFSRDGSFLASCGADATVRLWPAETLEEAEAATRAKKENQ
jgi:eukaryotic-like serine/threonine-protein kinase